MNITQMIRTASITGAAFLMLAATAAAATITFNTNAAGTGFGGTTLALNSTSGEAATLTFIAALDTVTGVPSNVNFGNFTLVCGTCSTQAGGVGATFGAFTFDLVVTDVTDGGATGEFVGTSLGGTVYSNVSPIVINWSPLQIGPGTTGALTGDFGPTLFATSVFTGIVAPNSGAVPGQSTVQGFVDSASSEVPEPTTLGMVGGVLLAVGLARRRYFARS